MHDRGRGVHRLLILAIISLLAALSCGGGSGTSSQNPPDMPPSTVTPLSCSLSSGTTYGSTEAASDFNYFIRPTATVKAVMLFVDFPDAPTTETSSALFDSLVPAAERWYTEVSYGKLTLNVTPVNKWYRMSKNSADYGFASLTWQKHRTYIAEALSLADPDVDFSQYAFVYIVSSKDAQLEISPTAVLNAGDGVTVDGKEIRFAVTFGKDIRYPSQNYGSNVLIHETGHIFSLPDLYLFNTQNFLDPVGGWDVMSATLTGAPFLSWHRNKLGWLDSSQTSCMSLPGTLEQTITLLSVAGGLKSVVVPISTSKAYVVEVRQPSGEDTRLCDKGVLVYTVDASVASGSGPIRVVTTQSSTDQSQLTRCGTKYNATLDLGSGKPSSYEDASAGFKVEVLSVDSGSYKVRITNTRR